MYVYICVLVILDMSSDFFTCSHVGTERIRAGKKKRPRLLDRRFKDQEFGTSIKDLFASVWVK